jgi:hypothetical protein
MKKLITILLILSSFSVVGQVSLFTPLPLEDMQNQMYSRQQMYEANYEYLNNVMNWILDIQINNECDSILIQSLNKSYAACELIEKEDLSNPLITSYINKVIANVKQSIIAYNKRYNLK